MDEILRKSVLSVAVVAAGLGLVLAGCGTGSDASRSAAADEIADTAETVVVTEDAAAETPESTTDAPESATDETSPDDADAEDTDSTRPNETIPEEPTKRSDDPDNLFEVINQRVGGVLSAGTSLCFTNSTPYSLYITFSKSDVVEKDGNVGTGETACARGSFVSNPEVVGDFYVSNFRKTYQFEGGNQVIGSPWVKMKGAECSEWSTADLFAGALGSTVKWSDGALVMEIKRDSSFTTQSSGASGTQREEWINYRINVAPETQRVSFPSACWR